jgi:hypothetical protein
MFSADPASKDQAIFRNFGGGPGPFQRLPGLVEKYWWIPRLYLQAIQF